MRVAFLGTPDFAVPALQALLDHSYEVAAVFTQPDRPSGRGHKLQASPVKAVALQRGIPVYQPEKIRSEENRAIFGGIAADFIVAAAYGQILPGWVLRSARLAPVNVHASLLPRYRGAAPIAWAILNGDAVTGVTTMLMEEGLDSGPILLQREISISCGMTTGELAARLSVMGADLLIQTLKELEHGRVHPVVQDEKLVSWAPRITKEMAQITWNNAARPIHNRIRAMNPWPGAYAFFRSEHLQIWRGLPEEEAAAGTPAAGTVLGLSRDGIRVQCGEGTVLDVLEVQMPGKSRVSGRAFASGARLRPGDSIT
jgi:methionyl-tRNA formyltransferase